MSLLICRAHFRYPTELCDQVTVEILDLIKLCVTHCGGSDVLMVPVTGMYLNFYNGDPGYSTDQWILNEGHLLLYAVIITTNAGCGLHTPMARLYILKCTGTGRRLQNLYNSNINFTHE